MSQDFLSQDEVDALLKGVSGEVDEAKVEVDNTGVRAYDLAKQERIVRGRMPTLELINERFARQLRIGLFNFMRRTAEVSIGPIRVLKYNEFIRNLVVPTNLNIVTAKPLRGASLFIFDPSLVFLVVDNLFGGTAVFTAGSRDATLPRPSSASSSVCSVWCSTSTASPGSRCTPWSSSLSAPR